MYHLAAYSGNLADTANIQNPALADGILNIQNNNYLLPTDMDLIGAAVTSTNILNARLTSPKILQYNPFNVRPVIPGATVPDNPLINDLADFPLRLRQMEELSLQVTHSDAGMNQRITGLIWLTNGIETAPPGEIWRVRFTSTTAAVANAWTPITITLGQNLPDGEYAMVWSEVAGAASIAHRWTYSNQYFRPGMMNVTAETNRMYFGFYKPRFGVMGRFNTYNIPRLEVLATAATASWVGYFGCIKTR